MRVDECRRSGVSIPSLGFLVLRQVRRSRLRVIGVVSIPSLGFLVLRRTRRKDRRWRYDCFNPFSGFSSSETSVPHRHVGGFVTVSIPSLGFLVLRRGGR